MARRRDTSGPGVPDIGNGGGGGFGGGGGTGGGGGNTGGGGGNTGGGGNGNGPGNTEFGTVDVLIPIRNVPENVAEALIFILPYITRTSYAQYFGGRSFPDIVVFLGQVRAYNDSLSDPDEPDDTTVNTGDLSPTLYNEFASTDISQIDRQIVTSGLWQGGSATLTAYYTASLLGQTSASYIDVYKNNVNTDTTAQTQFAVGYAHINGSGSIGNTTKTTSGNRESAALYRQFANVILASGVSKFTFTGAPAASSSGYDDFYFIAFNRSAMREKVDPGNWELHLSGSTRTVKLIDDSGATTNPDVNISGRVFNIVSGSIASGTAVTKTAASDETTDGAPGLFYPDLGVLLLNTEWLHANAGSNLAPTRSSNTFENNSRVVYNAVSGAAYFAARREEEINSVSYFARARNDQFNFSSNPTYSTGSKTTVNGDVVTTRGLFKVPSFKGDPRSYITQVGLYDNEAELIAVAKLSQPVLKSFSREAVVKVKLDY